MPAFGWRYENNAKIINLTSGQAFAAGANSSAYHVSKAALNMLTESLANELWEFGDRSE